MFLTTASVSKGNPKNKGERPKRAKQLRRRLTKVMEKRR
jgi:hypothetical protein